MLGKKRFSAPGIVPDLITRFSDWIYRPGPPPPSAPKNPLCPPRRHLRHPTNPNHPRALYRANLRRDFRVIGFFRI
jgi:hypothetical protein